MNLVTWNVKSNYLSKELSNFVKLNLFNDCQLYSVPNLLVIQYLEILYLGGNNKRVMCERV